MHSQGMCNEVYVFLDKSLYDSTKMNQLKRKEI